MAADLDLQEGVSDAADIMLRGKAAHEQAAHDVAQLRDVLAVGLNSCGFNLADLHHQRHPRQQHPMVPVQQQLGCDVLKGLDRVWDLPDHPASRHFLLLSYGVPCLNFICPHVHSGQQHPRSACPAADLVQCPGSIVVPQSNINSPG